MSILEEQNNKQKSAERPRQRKIGSQKLGVCSPGHQYGQAGGTHQIALLVSCWRGLSAEPGIPGRTGQGTQTFYTTDPKAGSEATRNPRLPSKTLQAKADKSEGRSRVSAHRCLKIQPLRLSRHRGPGGGFSLLLPHRSLSHTSLLQAGEHDGDLQFANRTGDFKEREYTPLPKLELSQHTGAHPSPLPPSLSHPKAK